MKRNNGTPLRCYIAQGCHHSKDDGLVQQAVSWLRFARITGRTERIYGQDPHNITPQIPVT